jgi:hypothetical protein
LHQFKSIFPEFPIQVVLLAKAKTVLADAGVAVATRFPAST